MITTEEIDSVAILESDSSCSDICILVEAGPNELQPSRNLAAVRDSASVHDLPIDHDARCGHHPVLHDFRQLLDLGKRNLYALFGGNFFDQFDGFTAVRAAGT